MAKTKSSHPNFEDALKKLEGIVTKMEKSDASLEQSLKDFEEGVALARQCQQALREAEQKVQELLGESYPLFKDEDMPFEE